MAIGKDVELNFKANISSFEQAISKLPGMTAQETSALVRELERNMKRGTALIEREAAKTGRAQERSAQRAADAQRRAADDSAAAWRATASKIQLGLVAAGTAAAVGFWHLVDSVMESRLEIDNLTRTTGLSAATLDGLRQAAGATGSDFMRLAQGMETLPVQILKLSQGSGEAVRSFGELGLSIEDLTGPGGAMLDADQTLMLVMDRLGGMNDKQRAAAVAAQLLGSAGTEMMQAFADPRELQHFIELNNQWGTDVGPEAIAAAMGWQRATTELSTAVAVITDRIIELVDAGALLQNFTEGTLYAFHVITGTIQDSIRILGIYGAAWDSLMAGNIAALDDYMKKFAEEQAGEGFFERIHAKALEATSAVRAATDGLSAMQEAARPTGGGSPSISGPATVGQTATAPTSPATAEAEAVSELAGMLSELRATNDEYAVSQMTAADQIVWKYSEIERQIIEIAARTGEWEIADQALAESQVQRVRDVMELEAERDEARAAAAAAAAAAADEAADREAQIRQDQIDTIASYRQEQISSALAMSDQLVQIARDTAGEESAAYRAASLVSFRAHQASALSAVAIDTIAALGKAAALFPPPTPAYAISAGMILAGGAVNAAAIASQSPPEFYTGTPDAVAAVLHSGEAVLNARAVDSVGADAIAGLNQGVAPGPQEIAIVFRGRTIDRMTADTMQAGGRSGRYVRSQSRSTGATSPWRR